MLFNSLGSGNEVKGVVIVRSFHSTDWDGYKDLGASLQVEGDGAASQSLQVPLPVEPVNFRDRYVGALALCANPGLQSLFTFPLLSLLTSGVTRAKVGGVALPDLEGESPVSRLQCKLKENKFSFELFTQSYAGRITGGSITGGLVGGVGAMALMTIPQFRMLALTAISGIRIMALAAQRFPKISSIVGSSIGGSTLGGGVGGFTGYSIFYPPTTDLKFRGTFRDDGFVDNVILERAFCTPAPRTRTEVFYVNPRDLTRVQFFILEGGNGNPDTAVEWLTLLSKGPVATMTVKGQGFLSMVDFQNLGKGVLGSDHMAIKPPDKV